MIINEKLRKKIWEIASEIDKRNNRAHYASDTPIAGHERIIGFGPTSEKTQKKSKHRKEL